MYTTHDPTWERRRGERRAPRGPVTPTGSDGGIEAALRQGEEQFRALANALPGVVWTASTDGTLTFLSDRWAAWSGIQVRGTPGASVHPDERERIVARWMEAIRGDAEFSFESRRRRRDGEYRWFLTTGAPVRDAAGRVVSWCGTTTDIHELKLTQAALQASQERFRLATQVLASFLYDWDPISNEVEWFGGLERVLGFGLSEVEADAVWWANRIHPEDLARSRDMVYAALDGDASRYANVYRIQHRAGYYVTVADRGHIVRDEAGRAVRVLGGVNDISDRWRLELEREALLEREREAHAAAEAAAHERDTVLGIVSHDLGTPLSTIAMCARALVDRDEPFEDRRKVVDLIDRAVAYMYHMIRDLTDVASIEAGRLALDLRDEDPAAIVTAVAEMLAGAALDRGVALETRIDADLPAIRADAARVLQGLANLVTNAVHFTERGGSVTVRAEGNEAGVRFTVEDTGLGISAGDLPHVFDRYWQKHRGAGPYGTGLGLAITRGIIEAHGSALRVESTAGVGSRFSFTIPGAVQEGGEEWIDE
jgi:PAS domain S-box-containing protein